MTSGGEVPSVSGTLVRGLVQAAHEVVGSAIVERGVSAIEPSVRAQVLDAIPGQWIPIATAEDGARPVVAVPLIVAKIRNQHGPGRPEREQ